MSAPGDGPLTESDRELQATLNALSARERMVAVGWCMKELVTLNVVTADHAVRIIVAAAAVHATRAMGLRAEFPGGVAPGGQN